MTAIGTCNFVQEPTLLNELKASMKIMLERPTKMTTTTWSPRIPLPTALRTRKDNAGAGSGTPRCKDPKTEVAPLLATHSGPAPAVVTNTNAQIRRLPGGNQRLEDDLRVLALRLGIDVTRRDHLARKVLLELDGAGEGASEAEGMDGEKHGVVVESESVKGDEDADDRRLREELEWNPWVELL